MITGLTEGNVRKADQYWPDEDNKMMDLGNGVKLEHKEKSYQGTYFHRYRII
jgi:protein tyrosine phosphatase